MASLSSFRVLKEKLIKRPSHTLFCKKTHKAMHTCEDHKSPIPCKLNHQMTSDKKGLTNPVISAIYEVENTSQTHQPPDKGSFL